MAVKVCGTALTQGGLQIGVGSVHDSTAWYVVSYPSYFTDAITYKVNVINTGGAYATPVVLTAAQSGSPQTPAPTSPPTVPPAWFAP